MLLFREAKTTVMLAQSAKMKITFSTHIFAVKRLSGLKLEYRFYLRIVKV